MKRVTISLTFSISLLLLVLSALSAQAQYSQPPPAPASTSTVITQSGGVLTTVNSPIKVLFPPGALPSPITATLSISLSPTLPARLTQMSPVFAVAARDVASSQPLERLTATLMTITTHFTPSTELGPDGLVIVYQDVAAGKWVPLQTYVDTWQHAATATTDRLGHFALVWRETVAALPANAIIVDDLDAGFARFGTEVYWQDEYTTTANYWAGHMFWTYRQEGERDNYAIWTPELEPGPYEVYAFIASYNTNTDNARYHIVHQGITTVQPLAQRPYFAEWASLGTYDFGSGAGNYVLLDDVTDEDELTRIGFDALGFVPRSVYLPLVVKNHPLPINSKSGIHLGNRSADWTDDMLQPIDGAQDGVFPAVVVVNSDQLYEIWRGGDICEVGGINPQPRAPDLFEYLKKASDADTMVIIRINPSPGNFRDWDDSTQSDHHLLTGTVPAGGTYCELSPGSQDWGFMHYRAVDDIAKEIDQIHTMNKNNGWQEYAFEPANEPNLEWYTTTVKDNFVSYPLINDHMAWQEMDDYFVALYDTVKALPDGSNIRLLTPPMAQSRYAEGVLLQSPDCEPMRLTDSWIGYNVMQTTYMTKNDGVSWHNYWTYGHESIIPYCNWGDGEHLSSVFPGWLYKKVHIGTELAFITEADLASPGQKMGSVLTDKDADVILTRISIQNFFQAEPYLIHPVAWLLNNNFADLPGQHENAEIKWHQAYTPTIGIRPWFTEWWSRPDQTRKGR